MYLLKNECCFECGGIAVTVPKNYCVDGTPADSNGDTLYFCSPDKSIRVSYEMQYCCCGTKEAML